MTEVSVRRQCQPYYSFLLHLSYNMSVRTCWALLGSISQTQPARNSDWRFYRHGQPDHRMDTRAATG